VDQASIDALDWVMTIVAGAARVIQIGRRGADYGRAPRVFAPEILSAAGVNATDRQAQWRATCSGPICGTDRQTQAFIREPQ